MTSNSKIIGTGRHSGSKHSSFWFNGTGKKIDIHSNYEDITIGFKD